MHQNDFGKKAEICLAFSVQKVYNQGRSRLRVSAIKFSLRRIPYGNRKRNRKTGHPGGPAVGGHQLLHLHLPVAHSGIHQKRRYQQAAQGDGNLHRRAA